MEEEVTELFDLSGLSKHLTWTMEQHGNLKVVSITLQSEISMDDERLRNLSKSLSLLNGIDRVWVSIEEREAGGST